ncbi:uncharacterized protein TRAVEDRAFT_111583 [Trametes versicolor FP-101664 SS1]|uniref:uncharacterized protein n=1 Tax=Trametes versicolor (strain FP-101664) TaxID=717944 RepID=UPI0004623C1B|nr:uncharacterized protein TRAVEDRAFT_111583 [Trametes versicolor FP-101664 SS1]EIW63861.1 hypothetical protein TRAVEDRAFT_111583 [Trametes versicolor FP-101664 SS1]
MARRYLVFTVVGIALLTLAGRVYWPHDRPYRSSDTSSRNPLAQHPPLPPLYEAYHEAELRLPQHHWDQRRPREEEKFLFVAGHSRSCGWGNAMQELLLNAYMAYKSGRSFVFSNYTWNPDGSKYSDYNGKKIPSLIPFSALIAGPIVGDKFPEGDHTPLAVHRDYFDAMCPDKVTFIREDISEIISFKNSAKEITDGWHDKLAGVKDQCVQTAINSGQIYNFDVFGDPRAMLDIWPELSTSPILTHFRWSPLVELAFDTNRAFFLPATSAEPYTSHQPHLTNAERYPVIPGLMALHVRRGDFGDHCRFLGSFAADYAAFSALRGLPDRFAPPRTGNAEADADVHRSHCYPSVREIVARVREIRASAAGQGLQRLHIMTNGDGVFIAELRTALGRDQDWKMITSSRDLSLNWEQKYVAQAVDMLVGQRAQVLIGNGFSTMTSNIVTMRMANRIRPDSTRFW